MKKLAGILIVAIIVCCLSPGVGASVPTVVTTGVATVNAAGFEVALKPSDVTIAGRAAIKDIGDLADLEVRPGTEIRIKLTADMFLDKDGETLSASTGNVALRALTAANIKLQLVTPQGRNASTILLKGDNSGSYISIDFAEGIQYVGGSFDYSIYLANNNTRVNETLIHVKGKVLTDEFEISSGDYVDTSSGDGAKAIDSARGVSFYIGEGVTITINTTRGRTYYGVATTDTSTRFESVLRQYSSIADIYRLQTVGLKAAGNNVRIDLPGNYYVYNTYGKYIGTTSDALPYWTTYFISTEKYESLDIQ